MVPRLFKDCGNNIMTLSSQKVLIVDDSPGMRKVLSIICRSAGITQITEAEDSQQAWKYFADDGVIASFDFIISDYTMPGMSGLDFLKRIRGSSRYKDMPFFMVTAESQIHILDEIRNGGATAILKKPFTSSDLLDVLRRDFLAKAG